MEGLMAHTINATSIFRSQRMYDPFKYSQLLGEDKTRCHDGPLVPAPGNDSQERGPFSSPS